MNEKEARQLLEFASFEEYDVLNIISNAKKKGLIEVSFKEQIFKVLENLERLPESELYIIGKNEIFKLENIVKALSERLEKYEN